MEARLASALQLAGHEVTYVTCGGVLNRHCVVMAGMHLPANAAPDLRERACRQCRNRAKAVRLEFGLFGPELDACLGADELRDIDAYVSDGPTSALIDSKWHGVPTGRRALFPFLVYKKKDDLELDAGQWDEYRDQLYQAMVAVSVARRLLAEYRPDRVVTYSATYSVVSAFLSVARHAGVGDYFVEASGNLAHRTRRAILGKTGIIEWFAALRRIWPDVEHLPANTSMLSEVGDHVVNLIGAISPFSYSAPSGSDAGRIRDAVGIPEGSKLLLATMSSYDEWFAAEVAGLTQAGATTFESQLQWLDWLVAYVAQHPEFYLVIRVHPREFPNRRERSGMLSSHARKLELRFAQLPPNCFINWPSQMLSLYDLAKAADVVLNAWSSAGKEMALLGLPVVEWAPQALLYAPEPRYCGHTPDEYAKCIVLALSDGWCEGNIVRMFRWCALEYGAASFIMRDRVSHKSSRTSFFLRASRRIARARVDAWIAHRDRFPAASLEEIQRTLVEGKPFLVREWDGKPQEETEALAQQIRRMAKALFQDGAMQHREAVAGIAVDDLRRRLLDAAHRLESNRAQITGGNA